MENLNTNNTLKWSFFDLYCSLDCLKTSKENCDKKKKPSEIFMARQFLTKSISVILLYFVTNNSPRDSKCSPIIYFSML